MFVMSWSGVIKYHGARPKRAPDQVYVANHTSLIDLIILMQEMPVSVVGQRYGGLAGIMQDKVLGCLGGIWFNRQDLRDKKLVAERIKEHIKDPKNNPLLIFPEGTCVNNEYCVMFKKGAFELDAKIIPIAIKYNKLFCDPFWNTRKQSWWYHLFGLMKGWAVVCDVYFLEPMTINIDETPAEFANRVKKVIAKKAGLKNVPWDGYLKHVTPGPRYKEQLQKRFLSSIVRRMSNVDLVGLEYSLEHQKKRKNSGGSLNQNGVSLNGSVKFADDVKLTKRSAKTSSRE
eukprot:TRINITY_DN1422_c0_g2_i3.p1 TRINITY_DN1422_c0_g2~~TRINITY_DN1422_c0_g2_i3.p1  ORF type:complete len:287 (-),score=45.00 TRINITY_DN1422_c0_g2_i3:5-865(-)